MAAAAADAKSLQSCPTPQMVTAAMKLKDTFKTTEDDMVGWHH